MRGVISRRLAPGQGRAGQAWGALWILALAWLLATSGRPGQAQVGTTGQPRYFAATGLTMAGEFSNYFDAHGGVPVFGYPITEARAEGGFLVQYFERERLEWHPEFAGTPYEVLLGRLGVELTAGREAEQAFQPVPDPALIAFGRRYVPETRHTVGERFAAYWDRNGGLALFGYPISEEFSENGRITQWFERARFEYHPANGPPYDVLLGLLGREALEAGDPNAFDVDLAVADGPTSNRRMVLGLAQGGESRDPDFLQNVLPLGRALEVPLVRIDNIYNHFDVVERGPDGRLIYNFAKLDRMVDSVRALGAEPYMCLGYMPQALAPNGRAIDPPDSYDEWRELVQQTVYHLNVERGLGIKYWEVWNEPNLHYSWTASYPDYLRLYDMSRDGMVAADPTARIGGPTVTPLDATAAAWLLGWQTQQGARGRADFISWHSFGRNVSQIEGDVAAARAAVAQFPAFRPELIISEFSVATGGPGDTSQGHRSDVAGGGAYALASLAAMERAGLDKAFIFELKDGYNPTQSYWGRWGLLTHDGMTKPAYHAIVAYQRMRTGRLPVQTRQGAGLGVELLAARSSDGVARLLLWHGGGVSQRTRISLPPALAGRTYRVRVFDSTHNNFARQGNDQPAPVLTRRGSQLLFDLEPDSFVILEGP